MASRFNIEYRRSSGNLHIRLQGEFSGMCAWELIKTIRRRYSGSGRVFVGTGGLTAVLPSGVGLFKAHMAPGNLPIGGLYFKGEKGFGIAPDGARVLICNRKAEPGRSRLHSAPVSTLKRRKPLTFRTE